MTHIQREVLSKVPAVTLGFWVIKILATTLGETAGDTVSMTMKLGYLAGTAIFLSVLIGLIWWQISAKRFHPFLYWATIIASTTAGTTMADYATRSLGIGYTGGSALLLGCVLASLAVWRVTVGSISSDAIATPKAAIFYWVTITFSQTLTAFQTATSTSGVAALVGVACLFGYGGRLGPIIGALTLGGVALYLATCGIARGTLQLWSHAFSLPRMRDSAIQVALGAVDNALAIGALWVLLPPRAVAFPGFVADYTIAYVGGALSGIPGGAGPFEGLLVKLLPTLDKPGLAAAFLGFRMIFNLVPLMLAGVLFAVEILLSKRREAQAPIATTL